MVKHIIPKTVNEALTYLDKGRYHIMAGGTDLMIQKRATAGTPPKFTQDVLYVFNLDELKYVRRDGDETVIGALTPLEDLLQHDQTPKALKMIIAEMASPGIRHLATIAGNIANASPAGDTLVGLYLLDAKIVLRSQSQTRIVPIESLITGVRKTTIQPNEMIVEIRLPHIADDGLVFNKVGGRRADAISKVSFMGLCRFEHSRVVDFRVSFGAISPTIVRSRTIEQTLIGCTKEQIKLQMSSILEKYNQLIVPIDDQRSSAKYRRTVALNLLRDMIEKNIL